jgi:hypothetical protein
MKSIYHILDKAPAIYLEDIEIEYESLAKQLVSSGLLRIDTDYYCNFVQYTDSQNQINRMFSIRELSNPQISEETKRTIKKLYLKKKRQISEEQIAKIIADLRKKSKKLLGVDEELQMQLARIFVQSAHPIVIRWLFIDHVEVFITYSNSIGDLMDIPTWKRSGQNSGMQSTDGTNVCIYVSCGGDPFADNNPKQPTYGDGWAAVARLMTIAGQEIGHFADIKRDRLGRQIARHSANFACTEATPHVSKARKNDILNCNKLLQRLLVDAKMDYLITLEEKLKFYDENKVKGLKVLVLIILIKYHRYKLMQYAHNHKMFFVKRFSSEKYMSLMIRAMILDMQSHLSPMADVYKRDNPEAEEAISCIEALARVPQQVVKWGYLTTKSTMGDLYKIYYGEVIPSLIDNYYHLTGKKYKRNYAKYKKSILQKILIRLGLNQEEKFKFTEVRELYSKNS